MGSRQWIESHWLAACSAVATAAAVDGHLVQIKRIGESAGGRECR